MKKLSMVLALLASALVLSAADSAKAVKPAAPAAKVAVKAAAKPAPAPAAVNPADEEYECVMITIWDNAPEYSMKMPTYGVKVGIFGSFGAPVYGLETSVLASCSPVVKGIKCGLGYTDGECVSGVLLAPVNLVDNFQGVAFGVVNKAKKGGVQIGILNFLEDGFLPCFPVINFSI